MRFFSRVMPNPGSTLIACPLDLRMLLPGTGAGVWSPVRGSSGFLPGLAPEVDAVAVAFQVVAPDGVGASVFDGDARLHDCS